MALPHPFVTFQPIQQEATAISHGLDNQRQERIESTAKHHVKVRSEPHLELAALTSTSQSWSWLEILRWYANIVRSGGKRASD